MQNEIVKFDESAFWGFYEKSEIDKRLQVVKKSSDLIDLDSNSIALIRKHGGRAQIIEFLLIEIALLSKALNLNKDLPSEVIHMIAEEIEREYYQLSPTEVHYIFRNAKLGRYGTIKFSIGMQDVLSWFEQYSEERIQNYMNRSVEKARLDKTRENNGPKNLTQAIDEATVQMLSKIKDEIKPSFDEKEFQKVKQDPLKYIRKNENRSNEES